MSKKCINCGQVLPDNASFCPHCTAAQTEKQEIRTPRQWKKKAAIAAGVLVLAAGISTAFAMYRRPQTYTGGAQIIYPDKDTSYQVLLTYSEGDAVMGNAQSERTDTLAEGMDSALPCQLYALDQESGKLAWEKFSENGLFRSGPQRQLPECRLYVKYSFYIRQRYKRHCLDADHEKRRYNLALHPAQY